MAQLAEGDSAGGPQTGSDYETAFASEADTDGAIRKVLRIRHEFLERKNPGCQPQHQPASASASASACLSISSCLSQQPQPQPQPQPQHHFGKLVRQLFGKLFGKLFRNLFGDGNGGQAADR